ncbi:hypothetical protein KAU51_00565 [Candidatus Parcubacteria bacterium]|nr:hypothetical protein [Candidatus Parcubacteria bacterium]
MEKIELGEVEEQLAEVNAEISALRDEFWGSSNWNDQAELEAKINALQEWKTKLEASKDTIKVICNGGIAKDVQKKASQRKKPIYGVDLTRSER